MKVLIADKLSATAVSELEKLGADVTVNPEDRPVSKEELIVAVKEVDGIIACVGDRIDGEVMDASGGFLKAVCKSLK